MNSIDKINLKDNVGLFREIHQNAIKKYIKKPTFRLVNYILRII